MISRRTVLIGGVAGAAVVGAGVAGVLGGVVQGGPPTPGPAGAPVAVPAPVRRFQQVSAAVGRPVNMVIMTPPGVDPAGLPVCLVLHGRWSNADGMAALGMPGFLAAATAAGVRPFAMAAVDGPDTYWITREPGVDPQAMLRDELPGWLTAAGLTGPPRAVLGISMGGFGGLVYARSDARSGALSCAALLSPALFRTWNDARRVDAFAGESVWAGAEPLRHVAELPTALKLGVWCGGQDPFVGASRQLAEHARPAVASFENGGHNDAYWQRILPAVMSFVGGNL